jgi:4-hydroxy-3-polyprenylbenzoate decarboxylase
LRTFVICFTGASGAIYGVRLVEELLAAGEKVDLVISHPAWLVLGHELGIEKPPGDEQAFLRAKFNLSNDDERLNYYDNDDLFAPFCSGSYRTEAVVIAPAAMAAVGAVANGVSLHLIERAADVALKEGRPLVIVPRETPFSVIHLENLTKLAQAGARIVPAMTGFYSKPVTLEDAIDFVVGKVLDVLWVDHRLFKRWGEKT